MSKNRIGNLIIISTVQSNIFGEDDNTLTYCDKEVKTDGISGPVHLYIIDEDAEIKEGDYYLVQHNVEGHILSDNFILCEATKNFMCNHYIKNIGVYLKIIASSNKEINVPIIEIPVLKELCVEWNNKVIKPYKTNWTREEVENLLRKAWRDSYTFYMPKFTYDFDATNKWIKNNIEATEKY